MADETVVKPERLQDETETQQIYAMKPALGSIDTFLGRHAGKVAAPLKIDDMNEIAASGWAGTDQET